MLTRRSNWPRAQGKAKKKNSPATNSEESASGLDAMTSSFGSYTPSGWAKEQREYGGRTRRVMWDDDLDAADEVEDISASPQGRERRATKIMSLEDVMQGQAPDSGKPKARRRVSAKVAKVGSTSGNSAGYDAGAESTYTKRKTFAKAYSQAHKSEKSEPQRPKVDLSKVMKPLSALMPPESAHLQQPELSQLQPQTQPQTPSLQPELKAQPREPWASQQDERREWLEWQESSDDSELAPSLPPQMPEDQATALESSWEDWGAPPPLPPDADDYEYEPVPMPDYRAATLAAEAEAADEVVEYESGPVPQAWKRKRTRRFGAGAARSDDGARAVTSDTDHAESDEPKPAGRGRSYRRSSWGRGQKRSPDELDDSVEKAVNEMVRLLTGREYGAQELTEKCLLRFTPEAVAQALAICQERGYQSEERYGQMLVRHMEFSLYGPMKLQLEARRKKVSWELLQELSADVDWEQLAYEALVKKYGLTVLDYPTQRKALAYVARRGFSSSCCLNALHRMLQEARENSES